MVGFSLLTALVLNMKIRGRGFFRGVFFYPVLLSPVVVALIWKWILQREGVLKRPSWLAAGETIVWLLEPAGRSSGSSSCRSGRIWASTR